MKVTLLKSDLILVLAAIIILPTLPLYLGLATSTSLGTVAAGLISLIVLLNNRIRLSSLISICFVSLSFCAIILIHLLFSSLFVPVNFAKALGSIILLFLFLNCALSIGELLLSEHTSSIRQAFTICAFAFLILGLLGAFSLFQPSFQQWPKPIFPFTEPSHYAVTSAPYLIYLCATSRQRSRFLYVLLTLCIAFLVQSAIMVVVTLLVLVTCFSPRFIIFSLLAIPLFLGDIDISYYSSRVDTSDANQNLSYLVYLQGLQYISQSLLTTNGLGLGFQQLGHVAFLNTDASQRIAFAIGDPVAQLNTYDGGFTLSKIVSEFGCIGIVIASLIVLLSFYSVLQINCFVTQKQALHAPCLVAHCFVAGYACEFLLRGFGYFTPGALMLVASLYILYGRSANDFPSKHIVN